MKKLSPRPDFISQIIYGLFLKQASLTLHVFGFDEVAQLQGPIIYDSKTAQRGFTLSHPRYYDACSCSNR